MTSVGIIVVKENSARFPGKNYFIVDGRPMFAHNLEMMEKCKLIDDVYVATNSFKIDSYCKEHGIKVIWRPKNISFDEQPYFDVLKYAYHNLSKRYDVIVTILGNSINHNESSIEKGIEIIKNDEKVKEIRSFDKKGNQSGIFIFREEIILNTYSISNHMAAIKSNGKEIHYKEELEK